MENTRNKSTLSTCDKRIMINLSEDEIISKNSTVFTLLTKRNMDTPRFVCLSCEKLCFWKNVVNGTKCREPLSGMYWKRLINYLNVDLTNLTFYICKYCLTYFRKDTLPPTCSLNDLHVDKIPDMIATLNNYEKILIQRAKTFQIVQKMGTV